MRVRYYIVTSLFTAFTLLGVVACIFIKMRSELFAGEAQSYFVMALVLTLLSGGISAIFWRSRHRF